jgi:hypothetical protein
LKPLLALAQQPEHRHGPDIKPSPAQLDGICDWIAVMDRGPVSAVPSSSSGSVASRSRGRSVG